MRIFRIAGISCLAVLFACAMGVQNARAGQVNCSLIGGMCGALNFGVQTNTLTAPVTGAPGWTGSVTSTVYFNAGNGLFTYTYSFTLLTDVSGVPDFFSTFNNQLVELFNPGDNFGVITNMTSAGVTLGAPGFQFNVNNSQTLQVGTVSGISLVNPDFSFYAQSNLGPSGGTFHAFDGGVGQGNSLDPAVPEPASLALFGTGLLLMAGLLQRKFASNA